LPDDWRRAEEDEHTGGAPSSIHVACHP
jgi:hypothetical protein